MEITVAVPVDLDVLAFELAQQFSHDELMEFISTLDFTVADWSFTEMMYDYAREQHKDYLAEYEDLEREMYYR